jgi:hypothetical protein
MNDKYKRATTVIAVLMVVCMGAMVYGVYKLLSTPSKGQECAVTLQFNNNVKATYIGKTV